MIQLYSKSEQPRSSSSHVGRNGDITGFMSALVNREILRAEERAGDIRDRFADPFFAVWSEFLPRKFR